MLKLLMGRTSPDGIPDGYAGGLDFDTAAFVFGIIVGVIITFVIIGIVKYAKYIIKDNKENEENFNSQKSDE